MATWQMRALSKSYNVIAAGPLFSPSARLSRHLLPLRSVNGPASILAQREGRSYTGTRTRPRGDGPNEEKSRGPYSQDPGIRSGGGMPSWGQVGGVRLGSGLT